MGIFDIDYTVVGSNLGNVISFFKFQELGRSRELGMPPKVMNFNITF
jgi:hypothetical protein